jgi:hypothetical protein
MNPSPEKRLTAAQALKSPWIASNTPKDDFDLIDQVRENFNPRAKLAGAIKAVRLMNRMKSATSDIHKTDALSEDGISDRIAENEEAVN